MSKILLIICTLVLSPLATHAQTVFIGPQGQRLGTAWHLGAQQRCQDDVILVIPYQRRTQMDNFFEAQERMQLMLERNRQLREQRKQRQNLGR